jgi:2-methylisocitrate lyase-like PEP mutase family enzyme
VENNAGGTNAVPPATTKRIVGDEVTSSDSLQSQAIENQSLVTSSPTMLGRQPVLSLHCFENSKRYTSPIMSTTQTEKALRFQQLHQRPGTFLIPNPWDAGSTRILAALGFEAFATSSGAAAATFGRRDGKINRDEALAHARSIAAATDLPVSADLERGFADDPRSVAETIRLAADAGLVGCSIEDFTGDTAKPLYDISFAAERIAAAAQTARSLSFPFTLTARAENFVRGKPDLDDTIARLQAYEKAGANVLFAPALPDLASVRAVCSAVSKPVNFMVTIRGKSFSVAELTQAGVKRISFASSLYRVAMTALVQAATEIKNRGMFTYLENTMTSADLYKFLPE